MLADGKVVKVNGECWSGDHPSVSRGEALSVSEFNNNALTGSQHMGHVPNCAVNGHCIFLRSSQVTLNTMNQVWGYYRRISKMMSVCFHQR